MNPLTPVIANMGKYSRSETLKLLGITSSTLQRWEASGRIIRSGYRLNGRPYYLGKELLRALNTTHKKRPQSSLQLTVKPQ